MRDDPFTLDVCLGAEVDTHYKAVGALRGSDLTKDRYGKFSVSVSPGQILTFFAGEYWRAKKRHAFVLNKCLFWIVAVQPDAPYTHLSLNGMGRELDSHWIAGHLEILAQGNGRTTSLRLLKWWVEWETSLPRRADFARHLGRQLAIRGRQEPEGMFRPGPHDIEIAEPAFSPAQWDIEI